MASNYEKQVAKYSKWLRSKNIEKRREAAKMVGELGAADQIEYLVKLAEKHPDPIVQQNATYSLGMFVAFRDAIEADDESREAAVASVEKMVETGKIGQRAKFPPKLFQRILFGLSGLLVLIILINIGLIFTPLGGFGFEIQLPERPTAVADVPDVAISVVDENSIESLVASAQLQLEAMNGNANTLLALYEPAVSGGQPGPEVCPLFYNLDIQPLTLPDLARVTYPGLEELYTEINNSLEQLNAAYLRVDSACVGEQPLTPAEANAQVANVSVFQASLPGWRSRLQAVLTAPTATPLPPTADPNQPTEVPTATITPTDAPTLNTYVGQMYNIIDDMTGPRGASAILNQYWREVSQNNGQTGGCAAASPTIPANYVLPPGIAESSQELTDAVAQINAGLQILRDGWADFRRACDRGPDALLTGSSAGLAVSGAAEGAFTNADRLLGIVRSGGS